MSKLLARRALFGGVLGGGLLEFAGKLLIPEAEASSSILNLTTRSPIDGTESVALATAGANWKAALTDIFAGTVVNVNSYSPTLTPQGGSITYSVVGAQYAACGNVVYLQGIFHITVDNGTGKLTFTLPNTAGADSNGVGFDSLSSKSGCIRIANGGTTADGLRYDGAYPCGGAGGSTFYTIAITYLSQ